MTDEVSTTMGGRSKENAAFSDASLVSLAREMGKDAIEGLVFAMYLNVPLTAVVSFVNDASDNGFKDATDSDIVSTIEKLVLYWKKIRMNSSNRDKLKEMERALREMNKGEIADLISEKYSQNSEMTQDSIAQVL